LSSAPDSTVLLGDRITFKLYAAQQHLNKLKVIDSKYGNIVGKERICVEMEIDCFLAQIIGAMDSLFFKINEKFELGIPFNNVKLDSVYDKLKSINKEDLLDDFKIMTCQKESWFWLLNELRNHSIHRAMLNKRVSVQLFDDANTGASTSGKPEVYFLVNPRDEKRAPMDKPIIPYLEESLQNMKNMIDNIRSKDSRLKQ
jgi:hypothetical protein